MPVANTKALAISNADATPPILTNRAIAGGPKFVALGTVEVAAADDDGSVYRLVRVPSNAVLTSVVVFNDAITGGTAYHVGFYQTAGNGGAVAEVDIIATSVNLTTASTVGVEVLFEDLNIADIGKRVWEVIGLTSDPQRHYDLALNGATVGTAAGTISVRVEWTI